MKKYLQQFRKLFTPADKKKFLAITFLMAIAGFMEMAGIGLLAVAANIFLEPEGTFPQMLYGKFKDIFPAASRQAFTLAAISTVVLLLIAKNFFALFIIALQSRFLRNRQHQLSCRLFNAYINADYRHYISRSADEYNGAIERIKRLFDNFFQPATQLVADGIVIFCLILASILLLPWKAIVLLASMVIAAWLINKFFQRLNSRLGVEQYNQELKENKLRLNVLLGMEQIKISGAQENFCQRFKNETSGICRRSGVLYTLGQIPRLALESVALLMVCVIFAVLIWSQTSNEEIMLFFTIIIAAMARVLPALSRAHYNLTQIRQNSVLLDEFSDELENIPPEIEPATDKIPNYNGDIKIENLTFSYTPDKPVITNLNCLFPARQITGIAGRSGIGKTTLINLIAGLFVPESGKITANNFDISLNYPAWRKQIGYVPQNVFIFDGSLKENIALGTSPEQIDESRIDEVLKLAQLTDFADKSDMILNSASGLSGGQRQRIGIARALYRNPNVLILDEATSALDSKTENDFLKVLQNLRGDTTVIVISHRQETLNICDQVIDFQSTAN